MAKGPAFMEFSDGINTTLDPLKLMESEISDVPDWIKLCQIPKAPENLKPLLDIYAEVMELQRQIQVTNVLIASLNDYIRTPWYVRAYRRMRSWLSTTSQ